MYGLMKISERAFILNSKYKARRKPFSLTICFCFVLCVLASFAHLGGERDGSHSAICCFEGRPREGLNANELNFPQRQIGNWHLCIVNQDHFKVIVSLCIYLFNPRLGNVLASLFGNPEGGSRCTSRLFSSFSQMRLWRGVRASGWMDVI